MIKKSAPDTDRLFGVEIECFSLTHSSSYISEAITKANLPGWMVANDGSIRRLSLEEVRSPNFFPMELKTPKLSGLDGLKQIEKVGEILKQYGYYANESCGLHVHINAIDLNIATMANIVKRYESAEKEIDSWIHTSRSGSRNGYCQSVYNQAILIDNNKEAWKPRKMTVSEIKDFISGKNCGKGNKINLGSYSYHGSIEFRHHHGTTKAQEINNWVLFLLDLVEKSRIEPSDVITDGKTQVVWNPLHSDVPPIERFEWVSAS